MDYENLEPHQVIAEAIEELAEAEGRMRAARDKMDASFLADDPDYEGIATHIDSALASAGAAIAEMHRKLHGL
jgi:hypothetical protein